MEHSTRVVEATAVARSRLRRIFRRSASIENGMKTGIPWAFWKFNIVRVAGIISEAESKMLDPIHYRARRLNVKIHQPEVQARLHGNT